MQLSPTKPVPVFILLFALSFITCIFFSYFVKEWYVRLSFISPLNLFVCLVVWFCSGCVWERESTSYALSYMLDTIWRLKSALQIFLSLVIVCVRVCVQWQQESSPRGFCWGLSWLTLPVQDIVQPKMNPIMSFQTWMLISLVEHNYQILKWTKIQGTFFKSSEAIWHFYVRRRTEFIVCIPVTAAFKCPSLFHIFKKAVSHWQQTWCNKSVSKGKEEDHQ